MEFKKSLLGENTGYSHYIKKKNIFDYFNTFISFVISIIWFSNRYPKNAYFQQQQNVIMTSQYSKEILKFHQNTLFPLLYHHMFRSKWEEKNPLRKTDHLECCS